MATRQNNSNQKKPSSRPQTSKNMKEFWPEDDKADKSAANKGTPSTNVGTSIFDKSSFYKSREAGSSVIDDYADMDEEDESRLDSDFDETRINFDDRQ